MLNHDHDTSLLDGLAVTGHKAKPLRKIKGRL